MPTRFSALGRGADVGAGMGVGVGARIVSICGGTDEGAAAVSVSDMETGDAQRMSAIMGLGLAVGSEWDVPERCIVVEVV